MHIAEWDTTKASQYLACRLTVLPASVGSTHTTESVVQHQPIAGLPAVQTR